jgi:hypothetical protein
LAQLPGFSLERRAVVTMAPNQVVNLPKGYAELVGEVANLVVITGRHATSVLSANLACVVGHLAILTGLEGRSTEERELVPPAICPPACSQQQRSSYQQLLM